MALEWSDTKAHGSNTSVPHGSWANLLQWTPMSSVVVNMLNPLVLWERHLYALSCIRSLWLRTGYGLDELDLWTTCIHHSERHFTDHWCIQTSVLSLLQSPLVVSWQQLLPREILQLPSLRSSVHSCPCRTLVNWQPSTKFVPGWWPFHTNLLVFSSQTDFQLNSLTCQPATSSHFTQVTARNWLRNLTDRAHNISARTT
jgi:hypothetical protein